MVAKTRENRFDLFRGGLLKRVLRLSLSVHDVGPYAIPEDTPDLLFYSRGQNLYVQEVKRRKRTSVHLGSSDSCSDEFLPNMYISVIRFQRSLDDSLFIALNVDEEQPNPRSSVTVLKQYKFDRKTVSAGILRVFRGRRL